MKWRLTAGLAMAAGLAVSACSTASTPARPAHPASRSTSGHRAPATAAAGLAAQPAATGSPAHLPGCTTAATSARYLRASLAVVRVADALAGRPALAGLLPAGLFPREMAVAPSGRALLVTCFGSGQLELVSLTGAL